MNRALAILEVGNKVKIEKRLSNAVLQSVFESEIVNLVTYRVKGDRLEIHLKSGHVITLKSWGVLESELDAAEAARAKTEVKRK